MDIYLTEIIGKGATADVYKYDTDTVLKLYHTGQTYDALSWEFNKLLCAYEAGVPVPRVYEIVEIGGRYGYIMEYIKGETLNSYLQKMVSEFVGGKLSDTELSNLLLNSVKLTALCLNRVHKTKSPGIDSVDDNLKRHTRNTKLLTDAEKAKILDLIKLLPKCDTMCHGDPNPNNIMVCGDDYRLIDWVNAGVGNFMYDIAEYAWLSTPRDENIPKDTPEFLINFYNQYKNNIIPTFINEYNKISGLNVYGYKDWMVPILTAKLSSNRTESQKSSIVSEIRALLNS